MNTDAATTLPKQYQTMGALLPGVLTFWFICEDSFEFTPTIIFLNLSTANQVDDPWSIVELMIAV